MHIPQPGGTLGHYRIQRVIGQGGMGVVYAATDLRLGREVALKVITGPLASTEEYRRRFHHEALAMSRVQSPWIVQIHDHDEVDGLPYIVTQFVAGTDLGSVVADRGPLTARRALRLCAQLARGLDDAHRAGVLHRDVKPGNVLLAEPGTPREHAYLCDFGIAVSDAASHHTQTGMVAGTWSYLAPERTTGAPAVPASDLYAVGCVLWTSLTGREPFRGSQVEIAVAHVNAPVPQLPGEDDFTAALNRLLTRVLAKDPAERHPDGAALAVELEHLAAAAPDAVVRAPADDAPATVVRSATPTTPPSPPPSPPGASTGHDAGPTAERERPRRPRRWPLVVAGVAALALVGGGATWAGLVARDGDHRGGDPEPDVPEMVTGDVDGDGLGDAAVQTHALSETNGELTHLLSTGTRLGPATPAGSEPGNVLLGDVDGDGRTDQVWFATDGDGFSTAGYRLRVVTADRDIWEHSQQLTAVEEWDELVPLLADVDGDGRDDLLFSNRFLGDVDGDDENEDDYVVTVHAALAGDRKFAEPETVLDLGASDHPVTGIGDFDGDGDDDLFRATNTFRRNTITGVQVEAFVNDGGSYGTAQATALDEGVWGVGWFLAGDPDGDGDDELVVTNGKRGAVGVVDYGDGRFGQVQQWKPGRLALKEWEKRIWSEGAPSYLHSLSDVNGDGADDLVAIDAGPADLAFGVALSDGTSFAEYELWGSIECTRDDCAEFELVANVQPSIL